MPNLVPRAALSDAIALSSSSFQVVKIAGPSVGGWVYAVGQTPNRPNSGADWVYGAAAGLCALALIMMLLIKRRRVAADRAAVSLRSLFEGLRFVWH